MKERFQDFTIPRFGTYLPTYEERKQSFVEKLKENLFVRDGGTNDEAHLCRGGQNAPPSFCQRMLFSPSTTSSSFPCCTIDDICGE